MPWLAVTLELDAQHVDALSDELLAAGALSVTVSDAYANTPAERPQFAEPGASGETRWERARVNALFNATADVGASVTAALSALGLDSAMRYEVARVEDQDWVRATQSEFKPLHVTPRLWVVPTWHTPPDSAAINLVIDPGLAFGTGSHATTRQCLSWLDANLQGGEAVLDYGCGSGILAIAAVKLGAGHATGVDIDEAALLAANANAVQNQAAVDFVSTSHPLADAYDIVLANILANPLKVLAPLLAHATRRGGHAVLSGILTDQAADVIDVYREWFDIGVAQQDEGWALLAGVRR